MANARSSMTLYPIGFCTRTEEALAELQIYSNIMPHSGAECSSSNHIHDLNSDISIAQADSGSGGGVITVFLTDVAEVFRESLQDAAPATRSQWERYRSISTITPCPNCEGTENLQGSNNEIFCGDCFAFVAEVGGRA